jgi:hypothetical protein
MKELFVKKSCANCKYLKKLICTKRPESLVCLAHNFEQWEKAPANIQQQVQADSDKPNSLT